MDEKAAKAIATNSKKAEWIVVATVRSLGPPPGIWSGLIATYQEVHYQPSRYLKGQPKESPTAPIVVFHPVVGKSLTADDAYPKLRDALFQPGAELILFLCQRHGRFESFDENYGVVRHEPEAWALIMEALRE